jgi:hypothetical protein
MSTKAQILKSAKANVHTAAKKYYDLLDAVKLAEKALDQSHKDFEKKTGLSWGEYQSQQTEKAFRRRIGEKEYTRLMRLRQCNELAFKYEKQGMTRVESCRKAWRELGWNSDCTKRLKGWKPRG